MKAIVAMDMNRGIGFHGKLPWSPIKEDLKFFKNITWTNPLLMGRTTFESIGKPLNGRFTYILTHDMDKLKLPSGDSCAYVSEKDIFDIPYPSRNTIWICGGASVYQRFLPLIKEIYVTHIIDEYECDTFMPEFESQFPNSEIIKEAKNYCRGLTMGMDTV
jgi:dihydrofolate reductase